MSINTGNQITGFAVAVDQNGYPGWVDFVVTTGGKWQYREGETCDKYHPLKYTITAQLLHFKDSAVECNLCKAVIGNLKDGYFTCQDICDFHCCLKCLNY